MAVGDISVTLDSGNARDIEKKLRKIDKKFKTHSGLKFSNIINEKLYDDSQKLEVLLKEEAHKATGALRDSIATENVSKYVRRVGVDGDKLIQDNRNVASYDYAPAYYWGTTKETIIVPKTKKALSWIGKDGKRRFAKRVTIPKQPGDKFVDRALDRFR